MIDLIPDYVKNAPFYHLAVEGLLLVWILWLIFRKSYSPAEKSKLTEKVDIDLFKHILIDIYIFQIIIFGLRIRKSCLKNGNLNRLCLTMSRKIRL